VSVLLGLAYPGGPAVSEAASRGNPTAVAFPRPLLADPGLDFSFSGLKTAVVLEVERRRRAGPLGDAEVADLCASFEAAAVEVLVERSRRAVARESAERLAVVGGVAANRSLRERMQAAADEDRFQAIFPPAALCTDNAAMIASAGYQLLRGGERHGLDLNSFSRVPIGTAPWARADAR
jgi:N6-L-threonylcarbamoyladenine synthase